MDPFFAWVAWLLGLGVLAVGVIIGADQLGLLHNDVVGGFLGIGLGVLCLFGAAMASDL